MWELSETCVLDVADWDGATLEEVGALFNVTRERVRQLEDRARTKLKKRHGIVLGEFMPEGRTHLRVVHDEEDLDDEEDEAELPDAGEVDIEEESNAEVA